MYANFPPPSPPEQFWVAETGATTHMTSNLAQLNLATPFSGADTVTTVDTRRRATAPAFFLFI